MILQPSAKHHDLGWKKKPFWSLSFSISKPIFHVYLLSPAISDCLAVLHFLCNGELFAKGMEDKLSHQRENTETHQEVKQGFIVFCPGFWQLISSHPIYACVAATPGSPAAAPRWGYKAGKAVARPQQSKGLHPSPSHHRWPRSLMKPLTCLFFLSANWGLFQQLWALRNCQSGC